MASALTDEQNACARRMVRELYEKLGNQDEVGKLLKVSQGIVSRLIKAGSTVGTTPEVLRRAAQALGKSSEETARMMGIDEEVWPGAAHPAGLATVLKVRTFDPTIIEYAVRFVERDGREFTPEFWTWLLERTASLLADTELRKQVDRL